MRTHAVVVVAALLALAGCPTDPPPSGFREVRFPDGFWWGTAVAQWQVEGDEGANGPVDSNWSRWLGLDKAEGGQRNPDGNGFFRSFDDDIARAAELGLTHFRLSIDWSRVEPAPGEYDDDELAHLEAVVASIRAHGMEPVLTLWHWVVPTWVQCADENGPYGRVDLMTSPSARGELLDRWEGFVRRVVERVGDDVEVYTVLNEPFSMISAGYIGGLFPPGRVLDIEGATELGLSLLFMHARAFDVIKELDQGSFVGLTQTANAFYPEDASDEQLRFAAQHQSYVFNHWIMRALVKGELDVDLDGRTDNLESEPPEGFHEELAGRLEFVGVQYYGPVRVRRDALLDELHPLYARPLLDVRDYDEQLPHNGMGREISAAGLAHTLWLYAGWGVPIVLTENGTTTNAPPPDEGAEPGAFQPEQGAMYLAEHLWEVGLAIESGLDVRGYFHWTLSDNFEWVEGRRQRFGAYSVDFDAPDKPRSLNAMGEALRDFAGENAVTEALWQAHVLERYPSDGRAGGGPGLTTSEPVYSAE